MLSLAVGCLSTVLSYEPSALRMRFEAHNNQTLATVIVQLLDHEYVVAWQFQP